MDMDWWLLQLILEHTALGWILGYVIHLLFKKIRRDQEMWQTNLQAVLDTCKEQFNLTHEQLTEKNGHLKELWEHFSSTLREIADGHAKSLESITAQMNEWREKENEQHQKLSISLNEISHKLKLFIDKM